MARPFVVPKTTHVAAVAPSTDAMPQLCYAVLYTKDPMHKKAKVWEDGILHGDGKGAVLFDTDGKQVSRSLMKLTTEMSPGQTLELNRIQLEVTHGIDMGEFSSGRVFSAGSAPTIGAPSAPGVSKGGVKAKPLGLRPAGTGVLNAPFKPPTMTGGFKPLVAKTGLVPTKGVGSILEDSDAGESYAPPSSGSTYSETAAQDAGSAAPPKPKPSLGVASRAGGGGGMGIGLGVGRSGGLGSLGGGGGASVGGRRPRHDPCAPGALPLYWPPGWPGAPEGTPAAAPGSSSGEVPVVVDPVLAKWLRPHQREGVAFLYNAVTGRAVGAPGQGCILADDMVRSAHERTDWRPTPSFTLCRCSLGPLILFPPPIRLRPLVPQGLGKTLQTITLIWTLLKQSERGSNVASIGKAVIVCPSSLVLNWRQEFKKWCVRARGASTGCRSRALPIGPSLTQPASPPSPHLTPSLPVRRLGDARCEPLAVNSQGAEAKAAVNEFIVGKSPVLIISYEMLRKHAAVLTSSTSAGRVGLLVADEAHRLKSSAGNQTIAALESLPTARRVLLTGTPLQVRPTTRLPALRAWRPPSLHRG